MTNSNFYFLFSVVYTTLHLSANKDAYPGSLFSSLCRGLSEILSHINGIPKLRVIKLQQHRTHLKVLFFLSPTSEVKLLYGFSIGRLLVLVVGDGGVLENKPVLFVRPQC